MTGMTCPRTAGTAPCSTKGDCHGVSMTICEIAHECVFCRIADGHDTAKIEAVVNGIMVIEPLNPVTPGHLLVIPALHVEDFRSNPRITADAAYVAAKFANEVYGDMDVNMLTSAGGNATQTVKHLHWHLVPRTEGDGLQLPWTGRRAQAEAWTLGYLTSFYEDRGQDAGTAAKLARENGPGYLTHQLDVDNPFTDTVDDEDDC